MSEIDANRKQMSIDFEYDDRVVKLALELAIMMTPHLAPGFTTNQVTALATKMAWKAASSMDKFAEPSEKMRCHTCDAMVGPKERARTVVCLQCGLTGGSPGSDG
jgi:hypothetical protein